MNESTVEQQRIILHPAGPTRFEGRRFARYLDTAAAWSESLRIPNAYGSAACIPKGGEALVSHPPMQRMVSGLKTSPSLCPSQR